MVFVTIAIMVGSFAWAADPTKVDVTEIKLPDKITAGVNMDVTMKGVIIYQNTTTKEVLLDISGTFSLQQAGFTSNNSTGAPQVSSITVAPGATIEVTIAIKGICCPGGIGDFTMTANIIVNDNRIPPLIGTSSVRGTAERRFSLGLPDFGLF